MSAAPDKLLMCRKCSRKLGADGKAMRQALKQALKRSPGGKVQLVKTGCLSLCPKRGQVLLTLRQPRERRLLVVQPGFALEDALDYLLGPAGAEPGPP